MVTHMIVVCTFSSFNFSAVSCQSEVTRGLSPSVMSVIFLIQVGFFAR